MSNTAAYYKDRALDYQREATHLREVNADLLAALEHARAYLGDEATDDSLEARETRRVINAAIARARGE